MISTVHHHQGKRKYHNSNTYHINPQHKFIILLVKTAISVIDWTCQHTKYYGNCSNADSSQELLVVTFDLRVWSFKHPYHDQLCNKIKRWNQMRPNVHGLTMTHHDSPGCFGEAHVWISSITISDVFSFGIVQSLFEQFKFFFVVN